MLFEEMELDLSVDCGQLWSVFGVHWDEVHPHQ